MILFKIQFPYKEQIIDASVHELENHPKQWHITIEDGNWPKEIQGTYIIQYDTKKNEYTWGFPSFDFDHAFMHSMGLSLRNYLWKYGWASLKV